MKNYRRPFGHRKDGNQSAIQKRLDQCPKLVTFDTSQHAGLGFDMMVTVDGLNLLYEVKQPGKRKQLTLAEEAFMQRTRGHMAVVETFWEVVDDIDGHVDFDLRSYFEQLEALQRADAQDD